MQQIQNPYRAHSILMALSIVVLLISLGGSAHIDPSISDENGLIEILQNIVLLLATIAAIIFARRSTLEERSFWLLAACFFFVLFGREISWGAVFLPLIDPQTYTDIPSSKALWYRPAITPAIGALGAALIAYFIKCGGYRIVFWLLKNGKIPYIEGVFFVIAALLTTAAERKMGMSLPFSSDTNYNIEETAELAAYLFLVTAALRIKLATSLRA